MPGGLYCRVRKLIKLEDVFDASTYNMSRNYLSFYYQTYVSYLIKKVGDTLAARRILRVLLVDYPQTNFFLIISSLYDNFLSILYFLNTRTANMKDFFHVDLNMGIALKEKRIASLDDKNAFAYVIK